jgi:hypothetical protein
MDVSLFAPRITECYIAIARLLKRHKVGTSQAYSFATLRPLDHTPHSL